MHKLLALAGAVGLMTTACSGGHGASSMLPSSASRPATAAQAPSTMGAHTVRAMSVSAPAGWAPTATGALALANATDLGHLDGTRSVNVVLGLQMRNVDAVKSAVASGQRISRDTFVAQYAPSSSQVSAAVSYLQSQGFTNVQASPNNMLVSATASAANVEKAFNTTLHGFSVSGKTYFANTQPAFVPTALSGNVVAVLGLTNAPGLKAGPASKRATSGIKPAVFDANGSPTGPDGCTENVNTTTGAPVCPRFYDPPTFNITYDAGSTPAATGTDVAIFVEGDPSIAISDFRDNESRYGMPQVPINLIHAGPASSDISGNGEWVLDMTYSQGMAYNIKQLDLYDATSMSFTDLTVAFNKWASDDIAPIMNASVGGCEAFPYQSGDMLVGDMILLEAAVQGQTLFASTGDTGAYCGVAGVPPNGGVGGAPLVEYPASSPYAVAVGGTDLFSNVDGTYLGEQAWQSGGGGISQFEYSPYWESPTQIVGTTPVGLTFRGVPDVAYDAALETGALVWMGGTEYITAGTSLASPMAAGVYARMQSAHGNSLGFAAPLFYSVYQKSTPQQIAGPPETELIGPFHDVLQGTNGLYTALPKYDYTTGMGSFDIAKLYAALR
ncbi:MAG TPA: protease pro-enzyme activation domain-containing protein [Candidatus Elarobacter sp.]|jgi:subtilase family serine protease|nr:protease pro-enzyme activation domain-containing protein [Candidatus Elarobacter sp.]